MAKEDCWRRRPATSSCSTARRSAPSSASPEPLPRRSLRQIPIVQIGGLRKVYVQREAVRAYFESKPSRRTRFRREKGPGGTKRSVTHA